MCSFVFFFFFSSRRRHTRFSRDWSSDVCSSDLFVARAALNNLARVALARRDAESLRRCLSNSFPLLGGEPELRSLTESFDLLARLCCLEKRPEAAVRAAAAAERAREITGVDVQ